MENSINQKTIVIVDDDQVVLNAIRSFLTLETDYIVRDFLSPNKALSFLKNNDIDLVIADYLMPEMDGITFLAKAREIHPEAPRIILTGYADKDNAIKAINEVGLLHYIEKPWSNEDLLLIIRNGLEKHQLVADLKQTLTKVEELKNRLKAENVYLREEINIEHNFEEIIGRSGKVKLVLQKIEQVASTDSTVLILGETGTGKELIARAIHNLSPRKNRPLVKVNCASLPVNLVESELFGHEKGSFTGAIYRKIGRFELADGGTIFLDEIGDMPKDLQVKLLRVLQEGDFERVGGRKTIKTDVRIIAATNRDLSSAMKIGEFREDLFYRLNVFPIISPPLRERKEDIPVLVNHFINKFNSRIGKNIDMIPSPVMEMLQAYYWPGNVRELENIIERALIISKGNQLELGDWLSEDNSGSKNAEFTTLEEIDRNYIIEVLESTGWRVSGNNGAATILGLKPTTLEARMKKLNIKRNA